MMLQSKNIDACTVICLIDFDIFFSTEFALVGACGYWPGCCISAECKSTIDAFSSQLNWPTQPEAERLSVISSLPCFMTILRRPDDDHLTCSCSACFEVRKVRIVCLSRFTPLRSTPSMANVSLLPWPRFLPFLSKLGVGVMLSILMFVCRPANVLAASAWSTLQ